MATRTVSVSGVLLAVNLFLFFSFLVDARKVEDIVQESSGGVSDILTFSNSINYLKHSSENVNY